MILSTLKQCIRQHAAIGKRCMSSSLPCAAKVVIVGGGIIGSSVAYHLGQLGWKDIVVLERDKVTSGTTWHAAGLMVTFGSTSETSTELRKYSKELYRSLAQETGQETGFLPVGFIEVAANEDRSEEYRRVAAFNRKCGVDVKEISPAEVKSLFPLCETDDLLAGFYVEDDGRVNPVDVTTALVKGAKNNGVDFFEGVSVSNILTNEREGKVTGVVTEDGTNIKAEYVINCAGMWARQLGELSTPSVTIPNQAAEHYYLITDKIEEVDSSWPVLEDPSSYAYIRPEGEGLMIGLFEGEAAAWNIDCIPNNFSFGEIPPDWERMMPYLEKAMSRVPRSFDVGAKHFFCGPESFTPDLGPIVGEAPEIRNYFVAAGMNSIGILTGGGIGKLLAEWIVTGKSSYDVTGMNINRFHKYQANKAYRADRVVESLGRVYKCHYPSFTPATARGAKRSPFHNVLKDEHGGYFKDVSGWESPAWYVGRDGIANGVKPELTKLSWGRDDSFKYWKREHEAIRNDVGMIDMSFMSKFLVQGDGCGKILNLMSTGEVDDGRTGTINYVQWLNDIGKLEADLTVSKIEDDKFFVVATDTMHRHVENWMRKHFDSSASNATITDVSGAYAQLNIQGPNSRDLMSKVTSYDMSNDNFPFRTFQEIDIGYARAFCARITYVGELGYELFIPVENAMHVYDRLIEAEPGLKAVGLQALGSLRLEKGYRDYGHDIDNTDTLIESGLSFTADFKKKNGFIGKESVLEQKEEGPLKSRLVNVLVKDPNPMMYHAEILYRNGVVVGDIRAGSYGHTLNGAVGIGHVQCAGDGEVVNKKYITEGTWEVDIAGKKYPAEVQHLRPFYDPRNDRIKM
jgi:glycine cleavage system aminomethyltransferase T/glycine/D-amino acid oxidase-like deaminating enzyme